MSLALPPCPQALALLMGQLMMQLTVDDAIDSCQCVESKDVALLECQDCGSFFEYGTYCPRLFE
jgi:hypothetical protein